MSALRDTDGRQKDMSDVWIFHICFNSSNCGKRYQFDNVGKHQRDGATGINCRRRTDGSDAGRSYLVGFVLCYPYEVILCCYRNSVPGCAGNNIYCTEIRLQFSIIIYGMALSLAIPFSPSIFLLQNFGLFLFFRG